jgi:hypothetical protein
MRDYTALPFCYFTQGMYICLVVFVACDDATLCTTIKP